MKAYLETFGRYKHLLRNLIVKDIKLKYRRSVLGILWSVLNPLLMMMVISAVFSTIFKINVEYFPIYYLTGSTLFNMFSETTSSSMTAILDASSLIKKVYIPKYIFPLEKCLFGFVNFLFSMTAVAIMYAVFGYPLHWTILLVPVPVFYTLAFSIGLGMVLSALSVFFRDMIHLYSVLLTAWTYFTPIMYPYDILNDKIKLLIKFNPMFHYVRYFRNVLMYNTVPGLRTNLICATMAFGMLAIGLIFFKKRQDRFILYI